MSDQSKFYLENAERLIGKQKSAELKRLLIEKQTSAFFTRNEEKRLSNLVSELMCK